MLFGLTHNYRPIAPTHPTRVFPSLIGDMHIIGIV
jgi:hypothetical protein